MVKTNFKVTMYKQLSFQLYSTLKSGDIVKITGIDQLGNRDWTGKLGVVNCFPKSCQEHISVWLVGYFLTSNVPLILPFTSDQLERTGRKHKTTWQYKTDKARNKARL